MTVSSICSSPSIPHARIGYPLLGRATSLGRAHAVPYSMLAINLLAIIGGTLAFAVWLAREGRSPWFAALYGLWPGMVFAVFRDLSEPLAYLCVAAALLVFRRSVWGACALLALALLTRETAIVFPFVGAVALWLRDRRPGRAVAFAAGAVLPMVAWRLVVTLWLHVTTLERADGVTTLIPFHGLASWWPCDGQHWTVALAADLPLVVAAAAGLSLLSNRAALPAALALLVNVALFVVFIPRAIVIDFGAAYRNVVPALIGLLCCLPWLRDRRITAPLALLLSPLWFILVAVAAGAPPIALMTS